MRSSSSSVSSGMPLTLGIGSPLLSAGRAEADDRKRFLAERRIHQGCDLGGEPPDRKEARSPVRTRKAWNDQRVRHIKMDRDIGKIQAVFRKISRALHIVPDVLQSSHGSSAAPVRSGRSKSAATNILNARARCDNGSPRSQPCFSSALISP